MWFWKTNHTIKSSDARTKTCQFSDKLPLRPFCLVQSSLVKIVEIRNLTSKNPMVSKLSKRILEIRRYLMQIVSYDDALRNINEQHMRSAGKIFHRKVPTTMPQSVCVCRLRYSDGAVVGSAWNAFSCAYVFHAKISSLPSGVKMQCIRQFFHEEFMKWVQVVNDCQKQ